MVREQLAAQLEADAQRREGTPVGLDPSRAAAQLSHELVGPSIVGRRRTRTMDNSLSTRSCSQVTIHQSPFVQNRSWADRMRHTGN